MLQQLSDSRARLVGGTGTGRDVASESVSKGTQIGIGSILAALLWQNGMNSVLAEESHEFFIAGVVWVTANVPVVWLWVEGKLAQRRARRYVHDKLKG